MRDKAVTAEKIRFLPFDAATLKPVVLSDMEGFTDWGKGDAVAIDKGLTAHRAARLALKLGDKVTRLVADALSDEKMLKAFERTEAEAATDAEAATALRNARRHTETRLDVLRGQFKALDAAFDFADYLAIICKGLKGENITEAEAATLADIRGKAEHKGLALTEAENALSECMMKQSEAEAHKKATGKAVAEARKAEEKAHGDFVRLTKWGNISG
jgi:hypothetical protein